MRADKRGGILLGRYSNIEYSVGVVVRRVISFFFVGDETENEQGVTHGKGSG